MHHCTSSSLVGVRGNGLSSEIVYVCICCVCVCLVCVCVVCVRVCVCVCCVCVCACVCVCVSVLPWRPVRCDQYKLVLI